MPYTSVNPTTGDVIKTFPNHTDSQIESALTVAHSLYQSPWSTGPIRHRLDVLTRLAEVIDTRVEYLARILVLEMGTRISEAREKSVLELGGVDVFVVLEDANLDRAARIGAEARLNVAGQVCNAAKRFVVHERIADSFLSHTRQSRLLRRVLRPGGAGLGGTR